YCIKVDDFEKIRNKFISKFDDLELIFYVKEFVESLHKTGVKIVIATNLSRDEFEKKTTKLINFISIFDKIFCGDDVKVTKFGNNKYKAVLECMSLTPKECLVFKDSPHGVNLALSQNIKVIWVQDKLMKEYFYNDLCKHDDNVYIFSSFNDKQLGVDQAIPCITFRIQDLYLFELSRKKLEPDHKKNGVELQ
ncbi:33324_t:CDS:2, partial [Gigaspora margarita]